MAYIDSPSYRDRRNYRDYLSLVVINKSELMTASSFLFLFIGKLGNHNVSAVASLAIDGLETPNLFRRPDDITRIRSLRLALHEGSDQLLGVIALDFPTALEEIILDVVNRHPLRLALDLAKDLVVVLARHVVEAALLLGGGDTGGRLVQVDVGDDVGGRVSLLRGCLVLVDFDGDGGHGDTSAGEVTNTLESQAGVCIAGDGFVLHTLA